MYSRNRPDIVFPVTIESKDTPSFYALAGRDEKAGEILLAVFNAGGQPVPADIDLRGAGRLAPEAKFTVLTSAGPDDENSFDAPAKVAPRGGVIKVAGQGFQHTFPAYSFTVLHLKEILNQ